MTGQTKSVIQVDKRDHYGAARACFGTPGTPSKRCTQLKQPAVQKHPVRRLAMVSPSCGSCSPSWNCESLPKSLRPHVTQQAGGRQITEVHAVTMPTLFAILCEYATCTGPQRSTVMLIHWGPSPPRCRRIHRACLEEIFGDTPILPKHDKTDLELQAKDFNNGELSFPPDQ